MHRNCKKQMNRLLAIIIGLLSLLSCHTQLSREQQEFCIKTFQSYLNPEEKLIQEREELYLMILKHSGGGTEYEKIYFRNNIAHIDSVMNDAISLTEENQTEVLMNLLEAELYNIYAHPKNDTYTCWDFHSVLSLLYSIHVKDDKTFYTKTASLAEFSRMQIEAVQANWEKPHPLYLQVLEELKLIYTELGNQSKIQEIERLIADIGSKP